MDEDVVAALIYGIPDYDALAAAVRLQHWGGSRRLTNALLGKELKLKLKQKSIFNF
jgi:hypothetical protein